MKKPLAILTITLVIAIAQVLPAAANTTRAQIDSLLSTGKIDDAAHLLASADIDSDTAMRRTRLQVALIRQDYKIARPLIDELLALKSPGEEERALIYTWLFARDDRAAIDRRTQSILDASNETFASVDFQAAGRVALELLKYDRADAAFQLALQRAKSDRDKAAALKGLGQVAYKRLDFDASLKQLHASVSLDETADGLMAQAETLIRLARTGEAITATERAIGLNPYHELAHYYLGNGYARKNYTELAARYGAELAKAGRLVRRASDAFERGDYHAAADFSVQALKRCPEYGRAHNAYAKALELQRNEIDVHHDGYERRFAATPMPVVPGIEKYVINWKSLSPRHQKRVALSIAPWKAFVPVLIAGGSTHYIKPLYMKLSETPGLAVLKDQRINTDSRLWDDVRGAGGFATVTGIEDVERTIFDKYNTVLHELTHQVHGVFTADQMRDVQEHYRRAKDREVATKNAFLSRYASGTVWEYFAEGVNALESPQRDAYDPREIVRERLLKMDPDLRTLAERSLALSDLRANLPIAYVNAGNDQLEKGHADKAMAHFDRAAKAAPRDEAVLAARLYGLAVKGAHKLSMQAAQQVLQLYPASGSVQTAAADAQWHAGRPLATIAADLAAARDKVSAEDRYQVDLALGSHYWRLGDVDRAIHAYDQVLAYQSDNPGALWGKGATLALAGKWDEASAFYERTIRLRTGVVELRADFARDLLRAGRLGQARVQLDAARLLDPTDPTIMALDGWHDLLKGDTASALAKGTAALNNAAWNDMARLVKAKALMAVGKKQEALRTVKPLRERVARNSPPEYVYRPIAATWISVHELPAVERAMLEQLLAEGK
ncbi:MAG: tetratricopeptide repeat protein [Betaproteobacteria bacterium]